MIIEAAPIIHFQIIAIPKSLGSQCGSGRRFGTLFVSGELRKLCQLYMDRVHHQKIDLQRRKGVPHGVDGEPLVGVDSDTEEAGVGVDQLVLVPGQKIR